MFISDPNFIHPGSRVKKIPDPVKEFKYFNPKNCFKHSELWAGLFIPDPDPDFLPIPDRYSGKTGTGSRIQIRNTDSN